MHLEIYFNCIQVFSVLEILDEGTAYVPWSHTAVELARPVDHGYSSFIQPVVSCNYRAEIHTEYSIKQPVVFQNM